MRAIRFLIFPGFQLLDLSGPSAVFEMAARLGAAYRIEALSPVGGGTATGCGLSIGSRAIGSLPFEPADTVIALGAEAGPLRLALQDARLIGAVRNAFGTAERIASVCTGAFLLAEAGLLDGRRATTHWAGCDAFERTYPAVRLERDALYVEDAGIWTSAGVTTGIDMALAMLRRDHGPALMGEVARRLVVYAHRPGGQSQFSAALAAQAAAGGVFAALLEAIEGTLDQPLTVEALARRAAMSERSFHRKFTASVGLTPAKFVETLRLDRAKRLLEGGAPVKAVAAAVGFGSEGGFRAAFQSRFGLSPSTYRVMHAEDRDRIEG